MEYAECRPSKPLAHLVERIWTLRGRAGDLEAATQPVLPDGRPELVMHFGDAFERISPIGRAGKQAMTLFAGQLTERLTLRPTGAVAVLGVRLHAYGAAPFFRIPQHLLAGSTVGVEELSTGLARVLRQVRDETDDVHMAVPLVQAALERWLNGRDADARLRVATSLIGQNEGAVSIDWLANRVSMTRRHLERLFLENVGLSPKRLARITRFQKALRVLERTDPRRRGTVTAMACGYADQSHFIREFHQLAGCSPAEHLLRQGELTGFFVSRS